MNETPRLVARDRPDLILGDHGLCPGCGEPVALRILLEVLEELGIVRQSIGVVGHGCYGSFVQIMDVEVLHDGCTGCTACQLVCPDYVFQVYRFESP